VVSPSLHNISGFKRDHGAIRVSHQGGNWKSIWKTSITIGSQGIRVGSSKKDLRISLTLLASSLSNSGQMVSSSLHNISGFKRDHSSVRVANQGGKWKSIGKTSISVGSQGIRVSYSKKNLSISFTLLAAIDTNSIRVSGNSSRVDISGSFQGGPRAIGSLGRVVLGSCEGYVGIKGSNSAIRVGDKAISTKNLGVS